ncbi:bifunctional DNA-formamidopyrimidine glycosylase/DNA-(apurinic or apyrimidinic site) lyase [Oryzibacter oryziterrae]|uniref:bifunctional DNA-formamidopyrimidine glycosylase/DNA-(apurinic or apyrimidinic site) lyase n=1 Tax=Oryzibacter oryziterrae TaxID=2766474 RepID=UPI001F022B64|nr:bifunctional DNA-formamidopyrimidine glycosylase/DNA-(apurinic or apyrimidinic site) lyase [Oryzibacter oryziterrae]
MPELPEVETVRRGLMPVLEQAVIASVDLGRPDLRFAFPTDFAARLTGRTVTALRRRSKYLLADLDDGFVLLAHLGMSGSFRVAGAEPSGAFAPGAFAMARSRDSAHDHVRIHLTSGLEVIYNDPRRFGFMDLFASSGEASHPRLAGLGPEPISNAFSGGLLEEAFAGRKSPIKTVLLDQSVVAGLGNIYVCEALHRSAISPLRTAASLGSAECARLAAAVCEVIAEAIEAGGSTLRDHMRTDGSLGYFQHSFKVYDREGCDCPRPGCGGTVVRQTQSGRSTFFCARCQA